MAVSREAVMWAFKYFLGRFPEDDNTIRAHMEVVDEKALARLLIRSEEFGLKNSFISDFTSSFASNEKLPRTKSNIMKIVDNWAAFSKKRIVVIGNCQVVGIAALIQAMSNDVVVKSYECSESFINNIRNDKPDIKKQLIDSDLVLMHFRSDWLGILERNIPSIRNKIKFIPPISFSAFHPDCVYIERKSKPLDSPIGAYHSSLAFYGWKNGLDIETTLSLFSGDVYETLGFFSYKRSSVSSLVEAGKFSGIVLDDLITRWSTQGCWMHTINHPKLHVLADIARAALEREHIHALPNVESYLKDNLTIHACWPVYPEIGRALGLQNLVPLPFFKKADGLCPTDRPVSMLGLEEFVRDSFSIYDKYNRKELFCDRMDSTRYQELANFLHKKQRPEFASEQAVALPSSSDMTIGNRNNPYSGLADYQYWRRAMEQTAMKDVDLVIRSGFTLNKTDRIATSGSCFAQHISSTLHKKGFNYYVTERGEAFTSDEATRRNYGVFSARFGNIYTARQLIQLFDRAYSTYTPIDNSWLRADGKLVDPFRPQVEPDGFTSIEDLESNRAKHFSAVREMFEGLDVFVFTLGLTEAWRSRIDGAVFPLAPGVVAGEMDKNLYEFVNFTVSEVVTDMQTFVERLITVNPNAKMLLTVSPVSLIATYENRHVLVSTTYSKSALRAAAEEICQSNMMCEYFPSYEIITGNYTKGDYFEKDLRSVKPEGVEHVMRLFLRHYSSTETLDNHNMLDAELMDENTRVSEILCDEEALDDRLIE